MIETIALRGVWLTGERLGRDEAACDGMPVLTLRIAGHRQAATEEGDVPEVGEHHAHSCIGTQLWTSAYITERLRKYSYSVLIL